MAMEVNAHILNLQKKDKKKLNLNASSKELQEPLYIFFIFLRPVTVTEGRQRVTSFDILG
jgi:hypothetical protein